MIDEIPKGWVRTTLGDVCLPVATIHPADTPNTEFTYFDIGGIDNERNVIAEAKTIDGRNAPSRARQVVRNGDILFSTVRTYLRKIARVERDYSNPIASTGFTVIRAAEGVSSLFLFFQVLSDSFLQPIHPLQTGSSYPAVHDSDVFAQPVLLPPTAEQERIVKKLSAALSSIGRAETATRRAQERLMRYRDAVLNAAVTGELTREWREAQWVTTGMHTETGEALLQRLLAIRRARWQEAELKRLQEKGKKPKDERWKSGYLRPVVPDTRDLPELPKEWAWASLEMIAEIGSGISVSQNRLVKNPVVLPYLRVANVLRGYLDLTEIKTIRVEKEQVAGYLLEIGDILFNEGGDRDKLGRGWVWEGQIPRCVHQNHVFRARLFDQLLLDARLVSHWGNTFGQHFFLIHGKQTTNLASINRAVLSKLPVPIPPVAEQSEIIREMEQRLAASDRLAATLEHQLNRTQETRRALVRDAFDGRLVPRDSNDEPATVLLERIRSEKVRVEAAQAKAKAQSRGRLKTSPRESMKTPLLTPETLAAAFDRIGRKANAGLLFKEAGCTPDEVTAFYETLRVTPEVLKAFEHEGGKAPHKKMMTSSSTNAEIGQKGRFRLIELWLEEFKNLKDYTVRFDPDYGLEVVLGWNGTGKSNLFEALVIVFRDLNGWQERNRWPEKPMNGYRLRYEINAHLIEIIWSPQEMKRPTATRAVRLARGEGFSEPEIIARTDLPLPHFVFGYYSGPTNRLAEHFQPMKQEHYKRLREATSDDPKTLATLLEQRRFFCAETHHAKYVLLAFFYREDQKIMDFLRDRLRIIGFESALFIIREPRWGEGHADDFWGAKGVMRLVMERLRDYAVAPMVMKQTVSNGYQTTQEEHYCFFLPDLSRLHSFADVYNDAQTFFLALESTDFSELIHDVKIQVRVSATNAEEVPITFREMSEGEQQLLMVLGLLRFTKSFQSLVLLDEPDTHLNPLWSVDYLKLLAKIMSDDGMESGEQQTSQTLISTHDPLVIASLVKEQIHLLKRDLESLKCYWERPTEDPRGLGFTGILTSEMFGFRSDLDPETLDLLDQQVDLAGKEQLSPDESRSLQSITQRVERMGFKSASSDPYYRAFIKAIVRRQEVRNRLLKPILTKPDLAALQRETDEILAELEAEEAKAK